MLSLFMGLTIWLPWQKMDCGMFSAKCFCFLSLSLSLSFWYSPLLQNTNFLPSVTEAGKAELHLNGCGLGWGTWGFRNLLGLLATSVNVATVVLRGPQ